MSDTFPSDTHNAIARVAAAYAARPDVSEDQIVSLVARLLVQFEGRAGTAASSEGRPAEAPSRLGSAGAALPALPLERAVTEDKVYCLCCGKGFKMLKRHIGAEHGLTEDEYRALFGLPADMPLVAPSYSERKSAYARKVGLGKYSREEASV